MIRSLLKLDKLGAGGKGRSTEVDPALNQVYLTLHQCQRQRTFIEVQLDHDDVVYQSMILRLDPEEKTILIDEFFPTGFQGLPGQAIQVRIRQKAGKVLKFRTVILESHIHEGAPLYVLGMPAALDADQRRGAYRLPIQQRARVESTFITPARHRVHACLRDLSASGVGLVIEGDASGQIGRDDLLRHVAFDFAGQHFDCGLKVKSILFEDEPQQQTLIGAEFVDLPPQEERLLARAIMRFQRERVQVADGRRVTN